LRSLEPSFSFLENPITVNVVGDGCPVSSPTAKGTAAVKFELLELQENVGLKGLERSGVSTIEFLEKFSRRKIPTNKECAKTLISIFGTTLMYLNHCYQHISSLNPNIEPTN